MAEPPIVQAENLGRRAVDGRWLLRHVSLAIAPGRRWAVSGPTGSGKTLLLRALALLDVIDEGTVLWRGDEVPDERVPDFRREVVYLHQRPVLVEGSVELNLRAPFGFRRADGEAFQPDRIADLLAHLQRDVSFLKKDAGDLSGGEQQVAALLRAMQLNPSVLLLDEPTAALDAESVRAIESLVDRWFDDSSGRVAVVWVSHDAAQVRRVADHVLHLEAGRAAEITEGR